MRLTTVLGYAQGEPKETGSECSPTTLPSNKLHKRRRRCATPNCRKSPRSRRIRPINLTTRGFNRRLWLLIRVWIITATSSRRRSSIRCWSRCLWNLKTKPSQKPIPAYISTHWSCRHQKHMLMTASTETATHLCRDISSKKPSLKWEHLYQPCHSNRPQRWNWITQPSQVSWWMMKSKFRIPFRISKIWIMRPSPTSRSRHCCILCNSTCRMTREEAARGLAKVAQPQLQAANRSSVPSVDSDSPTR